MDQASLARFIATASAVLVTIAAITDLRRRRIPNLLTFTACGLGLTLHVIYGGWGGLLLSVSGALLAPCILSFAHAGRGPGMGDMKLAAAIGALFGPPLASLAMLLSILSGGLLALLMLQGEGFIQWLPSWLRRRPHLSLKDRPTTADTQQEDVPLAPIPYGVALTLGTLSSLMVCQWTGAENWFFLLQIAAATR